MVLENTYESLQYTTLFSVIFNSYLLQVKLYFHHEIPNSTPSLHSSSWL